MNKRPKVQTEADYGLAEFVVAVQSGVPPGAVLSAIVMCRKRRGLQAECAKVPELAELSKLPYEEFAELIGLVEHEINDMQTV